MAITKTGFTGRREIDRIFDRQFFWTLRDYSESRFYSSMGRGIAIPGHDKTQFPTDSKSLKVSPIILSLKLFAVRKW
jgi:hypothetical protein